MSAQETEQALRSWDGRPRESFTRRFANEVGDQMATQLRQLLEAYQAKLRQVDQLSQRARENEQCRTDLEDMDKLARDVHDRDHSDGWAVCDHPICRAVHSA